MIAREFSCNTVYIAIPVIINPICDTEEQANVFLKLIENKARNYTLVYSGEDRELFVEANGATVAFNGTETTDSFVAKDGDVITVTTTSRTDIAIYLY